MTQKQYADMTTIMMFGRIFADQMYKCLENSGLLKEGFNLEISVGKHYDLPTGILESDIELCKSPTEHKDWIKSRMMHMKMKGCEWSVYNDPVAKAGTVPPEVGIKERRDFAERVGKYSSKPYPVDGMWISCHDDPPVLGGGW